MENQEYNKVNQFVFKPLAYSYDGLEPAIDKLTVEIHYARHHKTYFENFLKSISGSPLEEKTITQIFAEISKYPVAVRNNGGGYYNHELYWDNMATDGVPISTGFMNNLTNKFGSFDKFKEDFSNAGMTRFGSGWAWLCVDADGELFICLTPNQDNPLMDIAEKKGTPLLIMDVWEHAYYLKYQNKRVDYISAFWNIINWQVVEERYHKAIHQKK